MASVLGPGINAPQIPRDDFTVLADNNFKTAITNVLKNLKENRVPKINTSLKKICFKKKNS